MLLYLHHSADAHAGTDGPGAGSSTPGYFENFAGRVEPHPHYVKLVWYQLPRFSLLRRELLNQLLVALELVEHGKVLIDQRQQLPYSDSDAAWMLLDWLPRAVTKGNYLYSALLAAKNPIVRFDTHYMQTQAARQHLITSQSFEEETAAVAWLLRQGTTPQ